MGLFLLGHLPKPMLLKSNRTARSARLMQASRPSGGPHPAQKTEGTLRERLGLECYTLFLHWNVNFVSLTHSIQFYRSGFIHPSSDMVMGY